MANSSSATTPNLGTEPFEHSSPDMSHLSTPPSEHSPLIDERTTGTPVNLKDDAKTCDKPLRRSARDRKPTSKVTNLQQRLPITPSPKRRKTGEIQWVSPEVTTAAEPVSNHESSAHPANNELRQSIPVSSLLNPQSPPREVTIDVNAIIDRPPTTAKLAVAKDIRKISIEQDIHHAFLAKVHEREYNSQHNDNQRNEYLDKYGQAKNRIENQSHAAWKEQTYWPSYDAGNPVYYDRYGRLITTSSDGEKADINHGSEVPSPAVRGSKATHTAKNGKGTGKGGNRPNKGREAPGGRDRDSPDPPGKVILDHEERTVLTQLRQRQAELKKIFSAVGGQQKDILELMVSRDLRKLLEKPKAHTRVPAFDEVTRDLQEKEAGVRALINIQYETELHLADAQTKAQEEMISAQFTKRVEEAQTEHVRGAQGDLVLFRKAHLTAKDETRTNNGSDIEPYFPRYHELPEADTRPRGYTSTHIQDEKPFKDNLASYDEQVNQEVIGDDIVAPIAQSVAQANALYHANEERKARLEALVTITRDELRQDGGYLVPRPKSSPENPQFALSRLADCAEYISRGNPERDYIFMPLSTPDADTLPLNHLEKLPVAGKYEHSRPSTSASQSRPSPVRRSLVQRQKSLSISNEAKIKEEPGSQHSSDITATLPLIAPAPSRRLSQTAARQQGLSFAQMPPPPTTNIPPSPSHSASRRSSLVPLLLSRPPSTVPSPSQSFAQSPISVPPPPSPSTFGGPLYPSLFPAMLGHPAPPPRLGYPFSHQPYHPAQPPPPPRFEQQHPGAAPSPNEYKAPPFETLNVQHRFPQLAMPFSRPRVGGPKREPGQITFTPAQTPESERFKNPPQPQPLPPGQAVYRPSSLQQLNSAKSASVPVSPPAPPPDPNVRSQQAADVARQTATINQGQGAGPKGGRRILLPKKY